MARVIVDLSVTRRVLSRQAGRPQHRQMPLDMFVGKAVCLDLRHIPDLGDMDHPWPARGSL